MTDHGAYTLWKGLYTRCRSRGISHSDAEDLASETLQRALAGFDETKGKLSHFCNKILSNLIVDYWRSKKITREFPETIADDENDIEEAMDAEKKLDLVRKLDLTDAERAFLTMYGEVLEELGDRAVSETARRMGMKSDEGWNLFRKIQRKASRLDLEGLHPRPPQEAVTLEPLDLDMMIELRRPVESSLMKSDHGVSHSDSGVNFDQLAKEYFLYSVFSRFRESLGPEGRQMLGG